MTELYIGLLILGVAMALGNWRNGIIFCVLLGFAQDPLRKLLPGQPAYTQVTAAAVFMAAAFSVYMQRIPIRLAYISGNDPKLRQTWRLFIALIVFQGAHSLARFGNPVLSTLGMFSYLMPIIAVIIGYLFALDTKKFARFITVYLVLALAFSGSIYFSYLFGDRWMLLKEIGAFVGKEMLIYSQSTVMLSYSGLFRVGEMAAWHAATACMILAYIAMRKPSLSVTIISILLIGLLIGAIVLTGRRKMLVTLVIFASSYTLLRFLFWQGSLKVLVFTLLVWLPISYYTKTLGPMDEEKYYADFQNPVVTYWQRGATVFGDIGERFQAASGLVYTSYLRSGFLGFGVGVATQGGQYAGDVSVATGGAGEAGGGKLILELGIPGLAVFLLLIYRSLQYFRRLFSNTPSRLRAVTHLMAALSSMLLANMLTFFVATQLYGDLFVLLILGLTMGALFATAPMAQKIMQRDAAIEAR